MDAQLLFASVLAHHRDALGVQAGADAGRMGASVAGRRLRFEVRGVWIWPVLVDEGRGRPDLRLPPTDGVELGKRFPCCVDGSHRAH